MSKVFDIILKIKYISILMLKGFFVGHWISIELHQRGQKVSNKASLLESICEDFNITFQWVFYETKPF